MEHEKRYTYNHNINGVTQPSDHGGIDKKPRNYKLMADPFLDKTSQKVYRFEGIYVSSSGVTKTMEARDPRPRYQKIQSRRVPADLIVPRFKYDQNYVGEVPPKEVTFVNLNDNISREFLENMCSSFGTIEEVKIYYNPKNKKHLGVGKVLFENSKSARTCAERLNQTTKMGNVMSVFIDLMGKDRANILERIIIEQSRPRAASPPRRAVKKSTSYISDEPIDVEFDGGNRGQQIMAKTIAYKDRRSTESKAPSSDTDTPSSVKLGADVPPLPPTIPPLLPDLPPMVPEIPKSAIGGNNFEERPLIGSNQFHDGGFGDLGHMHPAHRGSDVHRPDMHRPNVHRLDMHRMDTHRPDMLGPDIHRPDMLGPDIHRPDMLGPDIHRPDIRGPDIHRPDIRVPDFHRPDMHGPDIHRPDRHRPDMIRPNMHRPELPPRPHEFANQPFRPFHPHPQMRPIMYDMPRPPLPIEPIMRPPLPFHQPSHPPHPPTRMFHPDHTLFDNTPTHVTPDYRPVTPGHGALDYRMLSPHVDNVLKSPVAPPKIIPQSPIVEEPDKSSVDIPVKLEEATAVIDKPRAESLDSRIQSLLQNVGMSSPPPNDINMKSNIRHSDDSHSTHKSHGKLSPSHKSHAISPKASKYKSNLFSENDKNANCAIVNRHRSSHNDRGSRDQPHVDDDRMSISSHSSLDDKSNTPHSELSSKTQSSAITNQAFHQSPSVYDSYAPTHHWQQQQQQQHVPAYNNSNNNGGLHHLDNSNSQHAADYTQPFTNNPFSFVNLVKFRDKNEDDRVINSVLEKFINDIRKVIENDICKKMVENSAYQTFESWWCQESDLMQPQKLLIEPTTSQKPSDQPLTSGIASLFESRHPWSQDGGLANGIGFTGGFLGIRGSMPKMPSFKRKTSIKPNQYEEDRKEEAASESEESDHEQSKSRRKPRKVVVSESDESESSEEEEGVVKRSEGEESGESSEEEEEEEDVSESDEASASSEEEGEVCEKESKVNEKESRKVNEDSEEDVQDVNEDDDVSGHESEADMKVSDEENEDVNVEDEDNAMEEDVKDENEVESDDDSVDEIDEDMKLEGLFKKEFGKDLPAARWTNLSPIFELNEAGSDATNAKNKASAAKAGDEIKTASSTTKKSARKTTASRHVDEAIAAVMESAKESDDSSSAIPETTESDTAKEKSESDGRDWSYIVPAILEHDYFSLPPNVKASQEDDSERTDSANEETMEEDVVMMDHCYCLRSPPNKPTVVQPDAEMKPPPTPTVGDVGAVKKKRERAKKATKLRDITNEPSESTRVDHKDKVSRELLRLLPNEKPTVVKKFDARQFQQERQIFYDIYGRGVDEEDVRYLKRGYTEFIQSEVDGFGWLNDILWIDHPVTYIPDPVRPKKRKKNDDAAPSTHVTGSARTEGYYKMSQNDKLAHTKPHTPGQIQQPLAPPVNQTLKQKMTQQSLSSREARSTNRRLQASFADLDTDLLRFNQLKFRKKHLKFSKSAIHEWGLFALEPIASDEMVIEYVGQKIRMSVANEREKQYEATGLGSSYMFRVDTEMIIDATKDGNLARFINHSCNPNCYAKVITIENSKKIVIYSKRDIDVNEEITYDYKFPIEDEKIPCLCGAPGCRGTLN